MTSADVAASKGRKPSHGDNASGAGAPDDWGDFAPDLRQRLWLAAVRLAPPGLRRRVRRHFLKSVQPTWDEPLDVTVRGVRFRAHFKDNAHEAKLVRQGRRLDRWHLGVLAPYLRPNRTFVDIGANCGFFSLIAARLMGDRGKILAIEPSPPLAARLWENIRLNGFSSIAVSEVAVGERRGRALREGKDADRGSACFTEGDEADGPGSSVPMMPLFDIVHSVGPSWIDVLKIDIEGAEDRALMPFLQTAPRSLWPQVIALEDSHRDRWQHDIVAFLEEAGYATLARGRSDIVLKRQPGST